MQGIVNDSCMRETHEDVLDVRGKQQLLRVGMRRSWVWHFGGGCSSPVSLVCEREHAFKALLIYRFREHAV